MAVVTGFPLLNTVWLAFTDASLTGRGYDWNWSGLENFAYILDDADFRAALGHTFYFTLVSVGIEVVLGVLVALLLDQEFFGRTLVRALLILPWALPTIVNAVMWRLIYNPEFGSLNALLTQLGLLESYRSWLGDPATAMNMVIIADVWKNYPLIALIVLAGLQTIPRDLYEAAIMDGAGAWTRFWNITLPGILGRAQRRARAARHRGVQGVRHHLCHDARRPGRRHQDRELLRLPGILHLSQGRQRRGLCADRHRDERADDRALRRHAATPGALGMRRSPLATHPRLSRASRCW